MNIEVERSAKAYAKEEILIATSAKEIYNVLSDINNWPKWQSNVKSAELNGQPEENKKFKWKADGLKFQSKLHTVNPYLEFGWTGKTFWISAIHNWTIKKEDTNSIVIVEESLHGFLSGLMKKSLQKGVSQSLIELKNYVEN